MRRTTRALWLVGAATFAGAGATAMAETRISGTVIHAEEGGRTFVMEELGVAGRRVRHVIDAAAGARVVEVTRDRGSAGGGEWPGGYAEQPATGVRPGDFVTVTLGETPARARTVEIARDAADEAAASPGTSVDLPPRR